MPCLAQALVAVAIVSTAIVAAAPTQPEKAVRRTAAAVSAEGRAQKIDGGRRRAKRQILIDEAPLNDEEDQIKQELSELSDAQLRVLADIVQGEIERFSAIPEEPEEYEIIEVPDELLTGRPRRSVEPLMVDDETPELLVVPDEVIAEALEEQQEDMELRMRIAEMAQILNERASRRRF